MFSKIPKFIFALLIAASCSTETDELLTQNTDDVSYLNQKSIVQNGQPERYVANSIYDDSNLGVYHGVFSTRDTKLKGEISINVGNDGRYIAELYLLNGSSVEFKGPSPSTANFDLSKLEFINEHGSFTLNVSGVKAIVTNATLHNKEAYLRVFKETSYGQVRMALGTFVDGNDPTFTGNWDLVSGPETQITPFGDLPIIKEIIVSINGNDFNGPLEFGGLWGYACIDGELGELLPPMSDGLNIFATAQNTTIAGEATNFSLIHFDGEYRDPSGLTCDTDFSGYWSRNGRFGSVTLD